MQTITIHPKNKAQANLFEQLAKVLNVPIEKSMGAELTEREKSINLYGKAFVEKIERGEKALKEGKGVIVDTDNLWK